MPLKPVKPVTLTGRFVRLEPIAERHRKGLRAAAADPAIWPGMAVDASTADGFATMMDQALAARADGSQLPFVVRRLADGRVVGSSRYLNIAPPHRRIEIGWTWYDSAVWGRAVNPDCKLLLLAHAFETLGAVRIELKCDARNTRSQRAILRMGAVREGVLRRHQATQHGFIRDTVMFSLLDDEWPSVRAGLETRLAAFAAA